MNPVYTKNEWKKMKAAAAAKKRTWEVTDDRLDTESGGIYHLPFMYGVSCRRSSFRRTIGRLEMEAIGRYVWGCE